MWLYAIFSAATFLSSMSAYGVQNSVREEHWQGGSFTITTEFSGNVFVEDVIWEWFPHSVHIDLSNTDVSKIKYTSQGVVYEDNNSFGYMILSGRTSALVKRPKPGLQPVINFETGGANIPVKGFFDNGMIHNGRMSFKIKHIPVYQDITLDSGWISRQGLPEEEIKTIQSIMSDIPGYSYRNIQDVSKNIDGDMFNYQVNEIPVNKTLNYAGGWVTTINDIRIDISGTEAKLNSWQGILSPVVHYF